MTSVGDACRQKGSDLVVSVRVTPRAKQNAVVGVNNGALQVRTSAPPAGGKANKAVIKLLAAYLDVPPSRITLIRGQASRDKLFLVTGAAIGL